MAGSHSKRLNVRLATKCFRRLFIFQVPLFWCWKWFGSPTFIRRGKLYLVRETSVKPFFAFFLTLPLSCSDNGMRKGNLPDSLAWRAAPLSVVGGLLQGVSHTFRGGDTQEGKSVAENNLYRFQEVPALAVERGPGSISVGALTARFRSQNGNRSQSD